MSAANEVSRTVYGLEIGTDLVFANGIYRKTSQFTWTSHCQGHAQKVNSEMICRLVHWHGLENVVFM